jgi:scyllo-inositol 2-dehydrogenase (NADP+)
MTASGFATELSPPPLRAVVVGLGRIGFGLHAPAVARHPGFRLAGVMDPLVERRAEAEVEWRVPSFASLDAMLETTRPDVVVIASPSSLHVEQACASSAHGAHVLCDKPVARTVAEFDRMLAAAQAAGRRFLSYQPHRLDPQVRALKAIIGRGMLGQIYLIKRARCNYVRRGDWQAFQAHGGGMLYNYGSHCLDELLWIIDAEPIRSVFCQTRCVATAGDAEDVVKAILVTKRGCLLDLDISQASAIPGSPWQVSGSLGSTQWDETARCWRVKYFHPEEAPPPVVQEGLAAEGRLYPTEKLPWREEMFTTEKFVEINYYDVAWRYFALGETPPVTPEETRLLVGLIERCRASAATSMVM